MSDANVSLSSEGVRIEVDTKKLNSLLLKLNDKDMRRAFSQGIRKSALIIRKQAQQNLSGVVNSKGGMRQGIKRKPLKNEINIAVYRDGGGARIDLMDKRRSGSRAYMLKFFELGTVDRDTKNTRPKRNRGSLKATHFFSRAVTSKKSEAEKSLEVNIINSVNRAISKYQ